MAFQDRFVFECGRYFTFFFPQKRAKKFSTWKVRIDLISIMFCCKMILPISCKSCYRVSHGKVNKVIWLCWEYTFWFLLIFWILRVHEKGTFMLNLSVFIFLMSRTLYRMICKNAKSFFGKNSLNVSNVKLFSKFCFQCLVIILYRAHNINWINTDELHYLMNT